jgi:hypothetical protein
MRPRWTGFGGGENNFRTPATSAEERGPARFAPTRLAACAS